MSSIASPIHVAPSSIFFRSNINDRCFGLAEVLPGEFVFAEILSQTTVPDPSDVQPIYRGRDVDLLKSNILLELTQPL